MEKHRSTYKTCIDEDLPSFDYIARAHTHPLPNRCIHAWLRLGACNERPGDRNGKRTRVGVDVLLSIFDLEAAGLGVARRLGGKAACHSKQERDDQKSQLHHIGEKKKAPLLVHTFRSVKGRARAD